MAGTLEGARKAKKTIEQKYGKSYWANIGKIGGENGNTGGFAANKELARIAGAKGGRKGKRGTGFTDEQISWALDNNDGDVHKAAEQLGCSVSTIRKRKKRL